MEHNCIIQTCIEDHPKLYFTCVCKASMCLYCAEQVFLDQTTRQLECQCPNCNLILSYLLLQKLFKKSVLNKLKNQQKQILLLQDQPHSQETINQYILQNRMNMLIDHLNTIHNHLLKKLDKTSKNVVNVNSHNMIRQITNYGGYLQYLSNIQYNECLKYPNTLKSILDDLLEIRDLYQNNVKIKMHGYHGYKTFLNPLPLPLPLSLLNPILKSSSSEDPKYKSLLTEYICLCPLENCTGYVNKKGICNICESKICTKCECVKDIDHKCDLSTLSTLKLYKKCPHCLKPVLKTEGCSQVYHRLDMGGCGIAFDWNTMEIVKSNERIHATDYYDEDGGKNRHIHNINRDMNAPCGGLPEYYTIEIIVIQKDINHNINYGNYHNSDYGKIRRLVDEVQNIINHNYSDDNIQLQIDRCLTHGRIHLYKNHQDKYKMFLYKGYKLKHKCEDVRHALQLFVDECTSIFQRLVNDVYVSLSMVDIEFNELRKWIQSYLEDIAFIYANKVPKFKEDWSIRQVGDRSIRNKK